MTQNPVFLAILLLAMVVFYGTPAIAADTPSGGMSRALEMLPVEEADKKMATLSPLGYHPFLMPLIMENRDAIELGNEQVRVFREWRSKYRVPLLHAMNEILRQRIVFQRISLNPHTSEDVLRAKQEQIFRLQQKVLEYQLSCRRTILDTFTDEQWDNFRFVLTENGYAVD